MKIYPKKSINEKIALIEEVKTLTNHIRERSPCCFYHKQSRFKDSYILIDCDLNVVYIDLSLKDKNLLFSKNNIRYYHQYNLGEIAEYLQKSMHTLDSNKNFYNVEIMLQRLSYGEYQAEKIKITLDRLTEQVKEIDNAYNWETKEKLNNFVVKMYHYTDGKLIANSLEMKPQVLNNNKNKI